MKGIIETCSRHKDLVFCRGGWVGQILVLEESRARVVCGPCGGGPTFPTSIVFGGRAQDKHFAAVFCKGAACVRLVIDQCLHANGDKRMPVVVMLFVDMRVRR